MWIQYIAETSFSDPHEFSLYTMPLRHCSIHMMGTLAMYPLPFLYRICILTVSGGLNYEQFTEITEVPFPEAYENFLSLTGIFSFDLSWILSATCMTDNLDFYDKLL